MEIDPVVNESWRDEAACRTITGTYNSLFFSEVKQDIEAAKQICEQCPVQVECLGYAAITRQQFGIWGGEKMNKSRHDRGRSKKSA